MKKQNNYIIDERGRLLGYKKSRKVLSIPEGVLEITKDFFLQIDEESAAIDVEPGKIVTVIKFPKSVEYIDQEITRVLLNKIEVHPDNMSYSSDGKNLFDKDGKTLYYHTPGLHFYNGVEEVEWQAVSIPTTLKRIEKQAFKYTSLKSIIFPDTLEYIGESSFEGFTPRNVCMPKNLRIIDKEAFKWARRLETVILNNGLKTIGDNAFANCESLSTLLIPPTVEYIGEMAFAGCHSLREIHIPDTIKSIGAKAFINCPNITIYDMPQFMLDDYCEYFDY